MKRGGLSVVDERIAEEQTYCEGTNVFEVKYLPTIMTCHRRLYEHAIV